MGDRTTILIVDDDPDLLSAAQAVLEGIGYRVLTEGTAEDGLTTARSERPGLIILDLMMEEADSGVRLAHQLRRDPDTQAIPVVIFTGVRRATGFDFAPVTREDHDWIGADAWVEKPIRPRELAELAQRLDEAFNAASGIIFTTLRDAQIYAFEKATSAKATGLRLEDQLKAYRAAPEIYKHEQQMAAREEALAGARKYVVIADPNDTQVFQVDVQDDPATNLLGAGMPLGFEENTEK